MASEEKELKNIEQVDFTNKKERVTSPHSRQALKQLGIHLSDLIMLTPKEFLDCNIDLKFIDKETQLKKYNHFNERREAKIAQVIEKRKELLASGEKTFSKTIYSDKFDNKFEVSKYSATRPNEKMNRSQSDIKQVSCVIEREKQRMEQLKIKQQAEIQGVIDYGFYLEEMRKRGEERMEKAKQKEERVKQEKILRSQEIHRQCEIKDEKREKIRREQSEELERRFQKREKSEKELQILNEIKRRQLEEENKIKHIERERNEDEFKNQVNMMIQKQRNDILRKFKKIQDKDIVRKSEIEKRRKREIERYQMISEENRIKLSKTLEKNEQILFNIKHKYNEKQKVLNKIKMRYEENKEQQLNELKLKSKLKEEEIQKVLEKNLQMEKQKIDNYFVKQGELERKKSIREKEQEELNMLKQLEKEQNEKKIQDTKTKYEELNNKRKNYLLTKLDQTNQRIRNTQSMNNLMIREKNLMSALKRDDHHDKLMRFENIMEFKRSLKFESLMDRMNRIDEMNRQKQILMEESRNFKDEMKRRKERMLEEYEILMRKGKMTKDDFYKKFLSNNSGAGIFSPKTSTRFFSTNNLLSEEEQEHYGEEARQTGYFSDGNQHELKDKSVIISSSPRNKSNLLKTPDAAHDKTDVFSPSSNFNTTHNNINNKLNEEDIVLEIEQYRKGKEIAIYDFKVKSDMEEKDLQKKIEKLEDNKQEKSDEYNLLSDKLKDLKDKNKTQLTELQEKIEEDVNEYKFKLQTEAK